MIKGKDSTKNLLNQKDGAPCFNFNEECEFLNIFAEAKPIIKTSDQQNTANDSSFVEKLLFRKAYDSDKEGNYQISHNDFDEIANQPLIEHSDDEYSLLKREIDSYIVNTNQHDNSLIENINNIEEENLEKKFQRKRSISSTFKKSRTHQEEMQNGLNVETCYKKSCSSNDFSKRNHNSAITKSTSTNFIQNNNFSICEQSKKEGISKALVIEEFAIENLNEKSKCFIPRSLRLESCLGVKNRDLKIDITENFENVHHNISSKNMIEKNMNNEHSACFKNPNLVSFQHTNNDKNSHNISNSSFSTTHNSLCNTPNAKSPESISNSILTDCGSYENLRHLSSASTCTSNSNNNIIHKQISNKKNLLESYYENPDTDAYNYDYNFTYNIDIKNINNISFKVCHINSFSTASEKDDALKNKYPPCENKVNNQASGSINEINIIPHPINSSVNNNNSNPQCSKNNFEVKNSNIINKNQLNINCNVINRNNFYDINNYNYTNSFYQSANSFMATQNPYYNPSVFYNNYQFINNQPNNFAQKQKIQKHSGDDPFVVLRDSNNIIISNGKSTTEDPINRINLENILRGKDKRTTLMIRNVPNKYTLQSILEDINIDFKDKYDLFYLPLDFINNCNLGYAFINFIDCFHILSFYDQYRAKKWKKFNSDKVCELAYAKFQGKKDLIKHFEKGSVMNFDSEDKKPLILPTPTQSPKISIPIKFLIPFKLIYPYSNFEILDEQKIFVVNNFYAFS